MNIPEVFTGSWSPIQPPHNPYETKGEKIQRKICKLAHVAINTLIANTALVTIASISPFYFVPLVTQVLTCSILFRRDNCAKQVVKIIRLSRSPQNYYPVEKPKKKSVFQVINIIQTAALSVHLVATAILGSALVSLGCAVAFIATSYACYKLAYMRFNPPITQKEINLSNANPEIIEDTLLRMNPLKISESLKLDLTDADVGNQSLYKLLKSLFADRYLPENHVVTLKSARNLSIDDMRQILTDFPSFTFNVTNALEEEEIGLLRFEFPTANLITDLQEQKLGPSDFTLIIDKERIPVHTSILQSFGGFLNQICSADLVEGDVFEFQGQQPFDAKTLRMVLNYAYTQKLPDHYKGHEKEIAKAFDYLNPHKFPFEIEKYIASKINKKNVITTLRIASANNNRLAVHCCQAFLKTNFGFYLECIKPDNHFNHLVIVEPNNFKPEILHPYAQDIEKITFDKIYKVINRKFVEDVNKLIDKTKKILLDTKESILSIEHVLKFVSPKVNWKNLFLEKNKNSDSLEQMQLDIRRIFASCDSQAIEGLGIPHEFLDELPTELPNLKEIYQEVSSLNEYRLICNLLNKTPNLHKLHLWDVSELFLLQPNKKPLIDQLQNNSNLHTFSTNIPFPEELKITSKKIETLRLWKFFSREASQDLLRDISAQENLKIMSIAIMDRVHIDVLFGKVNKLESLFIGAIRDPTQEAILKILKYSPCLKEFSFRFPPHQNLNGEFIENLKRSFPRVKFNIKSIGF